MDVIRTMGSVIWDLAALLGLATAAAFVAIGAYVWRCHRANRREARARQDERALRLTEQVVKDHALWSDFVRDHKLHKILSQRRGR